LCLTCCPATSGSTAGSTCSTCTDQFVFSHGCLHGAFACGF
jgi:hypothetical protein